MPEPAVRASKLTIMLAVAVALAAGASACSDDTGDLPPPASAPPASSSEPSPGLDFTPAEQQAVDEARAHFGNFMDAYVDVSTAQVPAADEAEGLFFQVEQHTDGVLPQELRGEIIGRWGEGRTMGGEIEWTFATAVNIDLDRVVDGNTIPRVDLQYCIDSTNWMEVNADTGEPVGEQGSRHQWVYGVSWFDDWGGQGIEGWRVVEREALEGLSC